MPLTFEKAPSDCVGIMILLRSFVKFALNYIPLFILFIHVRIGTILPKTCSECLVSSFFQFELVSYNLELICLLAFACGSKHTQACNLNTVALLHTQAQRQTDMQTLYFHLPPVRPSAYFCLSLLLPGGVAERW